MAKRPVRPNDLLKLVFLADPQIRPGGREILFLKKTIGKKNNYQTQLLTVGRNGKTKAWTALELGASCGRWSPDGQYIAFLGKRGSEDTQICLLNSKGGEAEPLTKLPEGDLGSFRWSPDGERIAFTFRERHPEWIREAKKRRDEAGFSTPPRTTESALYRWDGEGFFLDRRYGLYVLTVKTKIVRNLEGSCPWGSYSFDWSPDSKRLAVKRSFQQNLWRDMEDDRVLLMDLEGVANLLPGLPLGAKSAVRWSPDGKWVAFLGNPDPLDHRGVGNTELFVVPVEGGTPMRLTQNADIDLETGVLSDTGEVGGEYLEWSSDSKSLYLSIGWHGEVQLGQVDLKGRLKVLTEGRHCIAAGPPDSETGAFGCLFSNPKSPAEVALLEPTVRKPKVLTSFNRAWLNQVEIRPAKEVRTQASDGYPVHGWTIYPKSPKKGGNVPAVLSIHGGPHAQYGWTFFFEFQVLASAGFAVVYSNPRGSKGYGRAHVEAIAGAWGDKDWLDIEAMKTWMQGDDAIDTERIGVIGGSYGGYLVNWAVGHTNDFKAAITDRCVSNLLSKALNSDYPYYPGTYWTGAGYGPLKRNADLWRDSPMAYFGNVRTPMLIIHSEGDLRCDIEQGEQVFAALQERGIPSRMVRYPATTSHGMSRNGPPDLRIHRLNQMVDWLRERL